ncbi:uracil DNA glycosylase superfamily protein [Halalkalicoccus paucihalophilus]|uniref:Type-4 uracil-DNA glycosylase n=1 Tax=Halalkalicoccus paucihalophilus TaxID=1008153 RepID=A0A151AF47_9EURY|nr:uracil-DNA glycosylase [Halalkalicoccus paucihalophilus]KYH26017.1 uracil DNA glycosylase superfamily protein [Halalkalicoccus paucihalophilus]
MENMEGPRVTDCERCPALVESRSRIVNGVGPEDADLLIVGEAPGEQEDREGEPFVGRSGTQLDEKLREHGIAREDVRITNCVRCRPPENRDPTKEELENCRGYLEREIELIDPELVMTVGKVPTEHLLERDVAVTKEAGSVAEHRIGGVARKVLISVHPAAMLYDRSQEATLDSTIEEAAALIGAERSDQSRLDSY